MPSVSIIVPCYNEQDTIYKLLDALYAQTYPRGDLEIIIADGLSTDSTRSNISAFIGSHPDLRIRMVDNPHRTIPAALNTALAEAHGEIIARLDAHSMPFPGYIERCVTNLEAGLGENVGGVWEIRPSSGTWVARSIAVAAAHSLAVGDALYRHSEKAAVVDTVPFGSFKRELLARVGFFDETLLSNEDYEFNARIRQAGGKIWLDPSIRSVYFARPTLPALARQYARYGFWKWRMLRRYPGTLRWRQALPPLFVFTLVAGVFLAFFAPFFGLALLAELSIYLAVLLVAGLWSAMQHKQGFLVIGLPLAIATMHIAWGAGFLWSIINKVRPERKLKEN